LLPTGTAGAWSSPRCYSLHVSSGTVGGFADVQLCGRLVFKPGHAAIRYICLSG
jgi:hypothetical protein